MRYTALFFLVFIINGCSVAPERPKTYPSDFLFAQRSFPHGKIDKAAYYKAISERKNSTSRRSFNNPWTEKGPFNICGRVTDIEMPHDDTATIYAGSASGGIFKSEDRGTTWAPIFDTALSLSIGDIAIANTDSKVIYVGTGESNAGGGSLAYDGLGVYKSVDGGDTWAAKGLEFAGSIGRVVIDPNDDSIVFVAAMGALFENDTNGGVYKTEDGGDSWTQILTKSDSTGAIDLAIHPQDGNLLYAAMWERVRRPYNRQYGGETSGLYRSSDGGETWEELTTGLPSDGNDKGRIGIAISESSPNILYAYYADKTGNLEGIYRSDDGGDTWVSKSTIGITNVPFLWWFGKVSISPSNPDEVYVTSLTMHRSTDGANTWNEVFRDAHVDHHSLYIHPQDESLILNGNDGGVYLAGPSGPTSSTYLNGMSNFQFYTCEINPHNPEILLGGAQDNGTNIFDGLNEWRRIYGGDGFRVQVDPEDPLRIYAEFQRGNIATSANGGSSFSTATSGLTGRRNWNCPLVLDPNAPQVLYTGGQRLHRTINKAQSWTPISPVLINENNPTGNLEFGTLTAIDVSRHTSDVIYIGTDDGKVWVTLDYGETYSDISEGLPQRWITSLTHDPYLESGIYVTVSGFRFGEAEAQVYYSEDYGSSWKSIGSGLPDVPCNDIVADDLLDGTIYVATDIGVYVSDDRGESWAVLGIDLPTVPTLDLDLNERLLAVATFGRGMYTYDLPLVSSVSEVHTQIVKVYPNPASDFIEIDSAVRHLDLKVYNISGQKVMDWPKGKSRLSIIGLEKGIYFIKNDKVSAQFIKAN